MLVERRREAFPFAFLARVAIAWAAIAAFLVVSRWSSGGMGHLADPDDMLRLIQVRDLLAGQHWFDLTQYRIDAPGGGVPMHWSRLVDIPLALTMLALAPLLGTAGAESAALVIVPLLTLGLVVMLAMRIAWRLMGDEEATMTAVVLAFSMPVLVQFIPMRIDHHGWQVVCALVAVNGLMARSPRTGGRIIGAAFAAWLAISIEALPLAAITFAVLSLRWLRDRNDRVILVSAIQSLAVVGGLLFVAMRGIADLATYCDALSPLHLAIFGGGALLLTGLSRMEPIPAGWVLVGMLVTAAGAAGTLLSVAPQCATGGFGGLDPLVERYWHANVLEGRPLWEQDLLHIVQRVVTPVIGIIAALGLTGRSRDWLRAFWRDYALVLIGAFVISLLVTRASAVSCALAAPPVAWQLRQWVRAIRSMRKPAPRMVAMVSIMLALVPTFPLVLLANAAPAGAFGNAEKSSAVAQNSDCGLDEAPDILNRYERGEIFAPLDMSSALLFSHHTVVATSHHRGNDAMRIVVRTSLGSPQEARETLLARGTRYVAICSDLSEVALYSHHAPNGFIAQLGEEREIGWLEPVPLGNDSTLRLWRVVGN